MLRGLKMSSLVRKIVFYIPELTAKWEPNSTEILSIWNEKMRYINV